MPEIAYDFCLSLNLKKVDHFCFQKNATTKSHIECQLLQQFHSTAEAGNEAQPTTLTSELEIKPKSLMSELGKFPHLGFFTDKTLLGKILEEEGN
jgi:hypothetical protein